MSEHQNETISSSFSVNEKCQMKETGIEWLGEIPSNWLLMPLKRLCKIGTGNRDTIEADENGDYPFFVRSPEVQRISSYSYDGEAVLTAGDGDVGKIFHYVNGKYDCHQRVYNFTDFTDVLPRFAYYYLMSNFHFEVEKGTAKSTVSSLRMPMIAGFNVAFPNKIEQSIIISYLDDQCSKIDSQIFAIEESISKLEELKQSIIYEAVTKGLDKNVELKESGIPWIGVIPASWSVVRIKPNMYMKGRIGWQGLKADEFTTDGPYLVTGTNFVDGSVNWADCYHITNERYEEAPEIHLKNGDLLITKDGTVGKLALIDNLPGKASLNSHLLLLRPTTSLISNDYLYWVLSSGIFDCYTGLTQNGSIMDSLSQKDIGDFSFPLPRRDEMIAIVQYLKTVCQTIDDQIRVNRNEIECYQNLKQSLIYEYVTGKKQVPQEA